MIRSISHSLFFFQLYSWQIQLNKSASLTKRSIINEGGYDNCRKNGISEAFISLLKKINKPQKIVAETSLSIWEGEGG